MPSITENPKKILCRANLNKSKGSFKNGHPPSGAFPYKAWSHRVDRHQDRKNRSSPQYCPHRMGAITQNAFSHTSADDLLRGKRDAGKSLY